MARVVLVKHDDEPCDDRVSAWFAANGYECDWRYPYRGDRLGKVDRDVVQPCCTADRRASPRRPSTRTW